MRLYFLRLYEKILFRYRSKCGPGKEHIMDTALDKVQRKMELLEIRNDNENGRDRTVSKSKPNKP